MSDTWRPDFAATPPFAPYRPLADRLAGPGWPTLAQLEKLARAGDLRNARGLPLAFTAQTQRCGQRDYEATILETGRVPTREGNWHDLCNALVWLAWPRTKAALNAFQCRQLHPGAPRNPASDAATLFDESGLLLAGPHPELVRLLAEGQWREALVERREAWRDMSVVVLGHALLEKLLAPWPAITAKCLYLPVERTEPASLDRALAAFWERGDDAMRPARLFPLPVLGVPGWWADNENPDFYADRNIFRSRNQACTLTGGVLQASPGAVGTS
ncbi:MAG: DUF3025 domain-containing protein [Pseudomonadota bacterium]